MKHKFITIDTWFTIQIVITSLFIIGFITTGIILGEKGIKFIEENKSLIGTEIVIKEDTLMIINYQLLEDSYVLENNKQYDRKLIHQLLSNKYK